MNTFALIVRLLPTLISLMGLAEKYFSDIPKSGEQKKDLVTSAVESIIGGVQSVSTGGQSDTWRSIAAPISGIIDLIAGFLFSKE